MAAVRAAIAHYDPHPWLPGIRCVRGPPVRQQPRATRGVASKASDAEQWRGSWRHQHTRTSHKTSATAYAITKYHAVRDQTSCELR
eukprot:scaffold1988_cov270-Prasinococcus_capsulatus_cf.AAC.9